MDGSFQLAKQFFNTVAWSIPYSFINRILNGKLTFIKQAWHFNLLCSTEMSLEVF